MINKQKGEEGRKIMIRLRLPPSEKKELNTLFSFFCVSSPPIVAWKDKIRSRLFGKLYFFLTGTVLCSLGGRCSPSLLLCSPNPQRRPLPPSPSNLPFPRSPLPFLRQGALPLFIPQPLLRSFHPWLLGCLPSALSRSVPLRSLPFSLFPSLRPTPNKFSPESLPRPSLPPTLQPPLPSLTLLQTSALLALPSSLAFLFPPRLSLSMVPLLLPFSLLLSSLLLLAPSPSLSHPYKADLASWNININQAAGDNVLEYQSERGQGRNSTYTPSPANWRALPFYNLLLDKWAVRTSFSRRLSSRFFSRRRGGGEEEGADRARERERSGRRRRGQETGPDETFPSS